MRTYFLLQIPRIATEFTTELKKTMATVIFLAENSSGDLKFLVANWKRFQLRSVGLSSVKFAVGGKQGLTHLYLRKGCPTCIVVVDSGFMMLLTSQVISITFYSEHEKCSKFCSDALISAWGSFTCLKSTTRNPRLYFPSEGFWHSEKIHRPWQGLNLWTSDPVASKITMGPPGSTPTCNNINHCWGVCRPSILCIVCACSVKSYALCYACFLSIPNSYWTIGI